MGNSASPATPRRSQGCAASAGSTRSPPPGCARKSATFTASQSLRCCPGSWVWCRASTALTKSAPRARSPRPDRRTPGACWSRPPTTTATGQRWAFTFGHARPSRTRVSCRSPGAASDGYTSAGRIFTHGAASAPGRSRSPAHASSPRSAGRPRPWTDTRLPPHGTRRLPGQHEQPRRPSRRRSQDREHGLWATRATTAGRRPLPACAPGDEQGS